MERKVIDTKVILTLYQSIGVQGKESVASRELGS